MKNFTEYPKLRRGNMDYTKGPLITYTSLEPVRGGEGVKTKASEFIWEGGRAIRLCVHVTYAPTISTKLRSFDLV